MTRFLRSALAGLALAAGLASANPPALPVVSPGPMLAAPVGVPAVIHGSPGCGGDHAQATRAICVRDTETKSHTHTEYSVKCKTICLPSCGVLFGGKSCGGCGADACGSQKHCGSTRQVRVLVKRFVKEQKCESVCKPIEVPVTCARPKPCHTPVATAPCGTAALAVPAAPVALPPASYAPAKTMLLGK